MPAVVAFITKYLFTEAIMKQVVMVLGDYLVKSSKNKLDDVLWSKVKKAIEKG